MSYRITTNGLFRSYRTNLQNSTNRLSNAMLKVETGREFSKYSEDPATATQAFAARRSMWRTENQITNSNYVISKNQTAWSVLDGIIDGDSSRTGIASYVDSLRTLNDPIGSGRQVLGQDMVALSESIAMSMNGQYGDVYIFGGSDGLTVPFEWDGDSLTYRGVDVSNRFIINQSDGTIKELRAQAADETDEDYAAYLYDFLGIEPKPSPISEEEFTEADGWVGDDEHYDSYDEYLLSIIGDNDDGLVSETEFYKEANTVNGIYYESYEKYLESCIDENTPYMSAEGFEAADGQVGDEHYDSYEEYLKSIIGDTSGLVSKEEFENPGNVIDGTRYSDYTDYLVKFIDDNNLAYEYTDEMRQEVEDAFKLIEWSQETTYVDIGLGIREDDGSIVPNSAWNSALSGLNYLGFGVDEDGDAVNLCVLARQFGNIAERCDADTGEWASTQDETEATRLAEKLRQAINNTSEMHVSLDADTMYLENNLSTLQEKSTTLNSQIVDMEDVDSADAITEMMYAQYSFNAALQIGTSILSQSLLDYMT